MIEHLRLSNFNKLLANLTRPGDEESFYDITNGKHLDFMGQCPRLKSLTLDNSYLFNCNQQGEVIHKFLKTLCIGGFEMHPKVLTDLSARLPSLRHLILSKITIPFLCCLKYKRSFDIIMSDTSFDSIFFYYCVRFTRRNGHTRYYDFYVKLETDDNNVRWFHGNLKGVNVSSEDKWCISDFTLKIHCKKLRKLRIQYDEHRYQACIFDEIQ